MSARIPQSAVVGYFAHGPLPTYTGPPWRQAEPEHYESACDLIRFYALYPTATCSLRTARALAGIVRDFAPRPSHDACRASSSMVT